MKNFRFTVLLIPIMFAVIAWMGWGFMFRAAVSVSCSVIVWLMAKQLTAGSKWYVIAALLISICGDWFLSHRGGIPVRFIYGVCLYFMAHVGFLCFCLKNGRMNPYVLIALLAGFLVFFFVALRPALSQPALFFSVLAYLIVSCLSFAAATGLRLPPQVRLCFSFGIALLVFSDTIIALKEFVGFKELNLLIMPTYYAAHIFVTTALILRKK